MDAQNAAESDQTRPAGASPQQQQRRASNAGSSKSTTTMRATSPAKDVKTKVKPASSSSTAATRSDDAPPDDRDSDAETIVLPGKDGHSPSKVRKVRQEDKGESDGDAVKGNGQAKATGNDAEKVNASGSGSRHGEAVKRKRLSGSTSLDKDRQPRNKDGSSGLSSAPASPPHNQHLHQHQRQSHQQRRRASDAGPPSPTDSEISHYTTSSKTSLRDRLKSGERLLPYKRKAAKPDSDDDEADGRKPRRQRTNSASLDNGRPAKDRDARSLISHKPQHDSRNRSTSPQPRQHRRSASSQLTSQSSNGLVAKKKRLPPPLQPTDYHSDDSSASGSPHPRSSKIRSLATPSAADSNASPIKIGPHKKHLDAHGQTLLARACARGEYDGAKQRLRDRPEDLNVADYAGNTPLQIAAINGCEDIVQLLIDAGCNLDCVNYDKDTPLLDAVDNGHLGVVKLLVDAGVNPRKANVNGEEPVDRVSDDTENAEDIRAVLLMAKKRAGDRRRTSEDRHSNHEADARDSHAPESPRRSPTAMSGGTSRRTGTVRSTKTRNDLLYMPLDDKTLRQAAGRGDEETVARILQVKEGYDDPESMVAAARGGHDLVIQLLLGLGGANADPGPVSSLQAEFATPILAAIGQENIKVVELLLEQQGFDPTRRFKGETYYEIARRRQGTNWKEEEQLLRNSYDEFKRSRKDTIKTKSPGRRERDREREEKRAKRAEGKDDARPNKRNMSSPPRETESKRKTVSKLSSPKEKRRANSFASHGDEESHKRSSARPSKRDDKVSSVHMSDRETSPPTSHKPPKPKRAESDATAMSSDGELVKPRRKLVSKGELRGEREKQKRSSMTSNTSLKETLSPHESRNDDAAEKQKPSEKYHDRTKALKRDESRDRLSVSGDGAAKRHRNSVTPDRPSDADKDEGEAPVKRRRLDNDAQDRRMKRPVSEDGRPRNSSSSRDGSAKPSASSNSKDRNSESKEGRGPRDAHRKDSDRTISNEKSIRVKAEDEDINMPDVQPLKRNADESSALKTQDESKESVKARELAAQEEMRKEEERKQVDLEKKKREEEHKKQKAEEEKKKQEEEEERRKVKEQAEREKREAEEAARRKEEERVRLEEAEKAKKEAERKQREEEERLHKEQLEREAAEEARRQREEEERKERERRERAHREEMEKKRAAREAEQRRIREEQEQARLDKLPALLRWLDTVANPKMTPIAELFGNMLGVRYDTIRPSTNNTPEGREQWVLNTHVALLLGEKDLDLSRYTAWQREPVSRIAKATLWRTECVRYSLIAERLWDLGRQLPGYYGSEDPSTLSFHTKEKLKVAAWERFSNMDLFFVKVSDLLYTIPNIPHLRNIKLAVKYTELLESEEQARGWAVSNKWKQDPDVDRFHGFAPRSKYYVNGSFVGEELPSLAQTSKTPFEDKRAPRRGLVRVFPDDPEYVRICIEQGLDHLVKEEQSPSVPNGIHSSPTSQTSTAPSQFTVSGANGHIAHDKTSDIRPTLNGGLPNGINGTSD